VIFSHETFPGDKKWVSEMLLRFFFEGKTQIEFKNSTPFRLQGLMRNNSSEPLDREDPNKTNDSLLFVGFLPSTRIIRAS